MPAVFALRHEVFVVEQSVPIELEVDEYDKTAQHIIYLLGEEVVGTLRILNKNGKAKIGRVAVKKTHRHQGIGSAMMKFAIDVVQKNGFSSVFLESQFHAMDFYRKLGFQEEGDVFMDSGIPHFRMSKNIS
jgi:predicted GNAT family N-acyltransferase